MVLVGKLDDLVFNRRAIARADGLNLPAVHRRAVHVLADDAMRFGRSPGDVARHLRIMMRNALGAEAEWRWVGVSGLFLKPRPVDGAAIESRRSASLQAATAQAEILEASPSRTAFGSPERPAGYCCSPQWIKPLRKVPVVIMTA